MRLPFLIVIALSYCSACSPDNETINLELTAEESVQLFNISSGAYERDLAISPDGSIILYTLAGPRNRFSAIIELKKTKRGWDQSRVASFSGEFSDLEPAFHPDGSRLFFVSNRSEDDRDSTKDFDIWYVDNLDESWSDPVRLPDVINTSRNEFYPSITNDGSIYFTASYPDAKGAEDIYYSKRLSNGYSTPVSIDSTINSTGYEFNAFIDPDETYIIFTAYGRKDDLGGGDLYISMKTQTEKWGDAVHMGNMINSESLDFCPFVWRQTLFFSSETFVLPSRINGSMEALNDYLKFPMNGNSSIFKVHFELNNN